MGQTHSGERRRSVASPTNWGKKPMGLLGIAQYTGLCYSLNSYMVVWCEAQLAIGWTLVGRPSHEFTVIQPILHCTFNRQWVYDCVPSNRIHWPDLCICATAKCELRKTQKTARKLCDVCVWVPCKHLASSAVLPFGDHRVRTLINYLWLRNANLSNKLRHFVLNQSLD